MILGRAIVKTKGFLGRSIEEQEAFFADATKHAIARIHAAGLPSVHGDTYGLYYIFPDGRKVYEHYLGPDERPYHIHKADEADHEPE